MRTIATIEGFDLQAGLVSYEVRLHERTASTPAMISLHRAGHQPVYFTPRTTRQLGEALLHATQQAGGVA